MSKWVKATSERLNSLREGKTLFSNMSFKTDRGQQAATPKVGERELAAQAVAHKMMGLAPHERLALHQRTMAARMSGLEESGDGSSELPRRPRGKAEELNDSYYEESFDPVRDLLEKLPDEGLDKAYFDTQVGKKLLQLDVITERLSKQVMEHHDEMVKGMSLVMELEKDLQLMHIICKNGRRFLGSAMHQVTQDLVVTANVKRKQVLLDMLPILYRMQNIIDIKTRLESTVDEGNYAKGLRLCSECLVLVEECAELTAVQDLYRSIEDWLKRTVEKVDSMLLQICRKFEPHPYSVVVDAYAVMDDADTLAEKVQSTFAQCVVTETHDVLKSFVLRADPLSSSSSPKADEAQAVSRRARMPYNDLCLQLPESAFRQCLQKMLETLFSILCSYHTMMTWHDQSALSSPTKSEGPHHRRTASAGTTRPVGTLVPSNSFDGLANVPTLSGTIPSSASHSPLHSHAAVGNDRPAMDLELPASQSEDVSRDSPVGGAPGTRSEGDLASLSALGGPSAMDVPAGVANRMRKETVAAVRKALERGRKTVWELAARRVSALLSCDAICTSAPHHFLQSLEVSNRFILAGEAFSGAEATALRAKLVKQSDKYFKSFHRQNLEAVRTLLDKEMWQRLPPSAYSDLPIAAALTTMTSSMPIGMLQLSATSSAVQSPKADSLAGQSSIDNAPTSPTGGGPSSGAHASFTDWLEGGNPFSETRLEDDQHTGRRSWGLDTPRAETNGSGRSSALGTSQPTSPSLRRGGEEEEEEEEEENEELRADFIDEESQRPSRGRRRKDSMRGGEGGARTAGPVITNASLTILRYMDKYTRLMQILQPIGPEVFKGLCQLFELYLYIIFRVFGQKDAFVAGRPAYDTASNAILTPRLRATLMRITQGLEDLRPRTAAAGGGPASVSGSGVGAAGPGGTAPGATWTSGAAVQGSGGAMTAGGGGSASDGGPHSPMAAMISSGNLYGLKERCVATESIMCLAILMRRWRPRFQAMLPHGAMASMEHFYARTVDAVPDLREHVYKTLARLLLNVGAYVDRIGAVKWDLKDVGMEHNAYVDQLMAEYRAYVGKINSACASREVQEQLLEDGIDIISECLVEGYSRVKRCNNEGRALMSLDLQVLLNGLQLLSQMRNRSNMQIVDNFIKAFYLPETEYLHWARTHPEYTKSQIVGLVNLVASTNNWKRKIRTELIEKIEAGEI